MPTDTGAETIAERLARLRAELTRVRNMIARQETNGQSFNIGGTAATEIAYERAIARQRELETEITQLEARLAGTRWRPGLALLGTRMD